MWLVECPFDDQGLVRPLVTAACAVVLLCDEGGQVWLTPASVDVGTASVPSAPGWEVVPGVTVAPGTTRWATADDLPDAWRSAAWRW